MPLRLLFAVSTFIRLNRPWTPHTFFTQPYTNWSFVCNSIPYQTQTYPTLYLALLYINKSNLLIPCPHKRHIAVCILSHHPPPHLPYCTLPGTTLPDGIGPHGVTQYFLVHCGYPNNTTATLITIPSFAQSTNTVARLYTQTTANDSSDTVNTYCRSQPFRNELP